MVVDAICQLRCFEDHPFLEAFNEMRFQKCNSGCIDINETSIALHKALGFREEGRQRRSIYTNGRYYDNVLFGLTREEFDENDRGARV
jgi:RimJ/RimL family protein N-acetyltransferase